MPAPTGRPIVLVIENDLGLADALSLLMVDWGFTAVPVDSAAAAVRTLGDRISDVRAIVADYELDDGFTGIKSASAVARAIGRRVPTIMTTGHAMLAEHADVFPVLSKPFDPDILQRWLDLHVDREDALSAS